MDTIPGLSGAALLVGLIALIIMLIPFFAACSVLLHLKDIKQSLFAIYQILAPTDEDENDDPR